MDIRMPELDGLEATQQITADRTLNDTRVLVLTTFELDEYVFGALRAGASGFLLKGGEPRELLSAIRLVAAGESLLAPSVTRRLIEAYVSQPEHARTVAPDGLDELSPRELEVLRHVAEGKNNREIAEALYLSPLTVKTHVSRILTKLRARDRVQLVVIAYQAGLVSP
jgi:DNA-binding NarL/FixJ family response regulator